MNQIKAIRERLGLTQAKFGAGIGCSQNNVSLYESGQTAPPEAAKSIISFAAARGLPITFDHVYGSAELPELAEAKAGE
jgi:putative transcriptional regulator